MIKSSYTKNLYIYIYIYTYTHTHTHIYIYIYISLFFYLVRSPVCIGLRNLSVCICASFQSLSRVLTNISRIISPVKKYSNKVVFFNSEFEWRHEHSPEECTKTEVIISSPQSQFEKIYIWSHSQYFLNYYFVKHKFVKVGPHPWRYCTDQRAGRISVCAGWKIESLSSGLTELFP